MANEVTVTGSLEFDGGDQDADSLDFAATLFSVTTKQFIKHVQSILTTETTIDLGALVAPFGWSAWKNLDATNWISLRLATGNTRDDIRIPPLGVAILHIGDDPTALFAIASTATCRLAYLLCSR